MEEDFFKAKRMIVEHIDERLKTLISLDNGVMHETIQELQDLRKYIRNYILYKKEIK